jgi:hypothetical protein
MSYLLIKDLNINNIIVTEHRDLYRIKYYKKSFTLMGIVLELPCIEIIKIENIYYLLIKDEETINLLLKIDTYFSSKVPSYKNMICDYNGDKCIILSNNLHIDTIYVKKVNKILLNVKYIKKNELNYPIIHIIDG